MIGIIEIDEKDVSDDGYIIIEYPIRPLTKSMQEWIRVKTNIKFIEWDDLWNNIVKPYWQMIEQEHEG